MKISGHSTLSGHILSAALLSLLISMSSGSYAGGIPEYKLKAAYLFNVIKFISWDNEKSQQKKHPIKLCIYKDNPFGDYLTPWTKKKIQGRKVDIIEPETIQAIKNCHIVFIYQQAVDNIIHELNTLPVLTISDKNEFIAQDGMIQLKTSKQKLRIVINLPQVKQHKISISSRLLGASMVDLHE